MHYILRMCLTQCKERGDNFYHQFSQSYVNNWGNALSPLAVM